MSDYKDTEQQIAEQARTWLSMPKSTPEEEKLAKDFYREKVFLPSWGLFRARESHRFNEDEIYGLILTVGFSWEPLVLTISVCRPERVFFLCTPETEGLLDEIIEFTGLKFSQIDKETVRGVDSLPIYQQVLKIWEKWGRRKDLAADITGGTKAMTGALSMAGALLGLKLLYVHNKKYDRELRRPRPGTEYLEIIQNPYSVFGILQEKEVGELFRRKDYHGAGRSLAELVEKVPDPRKFEVLLFLSRAYEEWDCLNLKEAAENLEKAHQRLKKAAPGQSTSVLEHLDAQVERLKHLAGLMPVKPGDSTLSLLRDRKATETLVFTVYQNAIRMAERGKFDTASLYLYRLLEIFEQRRCAGYGIDTAKPDYSLLPAGLPGEESFLAKYNQVKKELKQDPAKQLPRQISLVDGYILLEAINDSFQLKNVSPKPVHWKWFISETQKRNHSILAHGFVFVPEEQYRKFKAMADGIFDLFCRVEKIDRADSAQLHHFIEDPFDEMLTCFI
ncbi:TIGR02710 family CRISPR-associated CARF protein [Dethiobacter alkaliphilus]|uniref:TIGR02710 family CRISPR-associated CARF protein n=1 Tax=Dethiobacter alkaliphilus TaxID=427926 RepID=UPI002227E16D|nr:TIGR02710 family CRISPR-associated CARF protein [Dethiobacter alkaliphilus]MCW3488681.1 TIGR02710 family CRISPR-associated CARF protein [Dethiobacter alkaliphilus]